MDIFPAGKFLTRCKEWALAETKKGEPQVVLFFRDVGELGQPPAYYGQFGEKSLPHTMKALRACGWRGTDITELEHAQCGMDSADIELVIEHEEYEGKIHAKTRWINTPGAGVTPLSADKKANFAQQLKAKILQLEQGQPQKPAAPSRSAGGPPHGHPADTSFLP